MRSERYTVHYEWFVKWNVFSALIAYLVVYQSIVLSSPPRIEIIHSCSLQVLTSWLTWMKLDSWMWSVVDQYRVTTTGENRSKGNNQTKELEYIYSPAAFYFSQNLHREECYLADGWEPIENIKIHLRTKTVFFAFPCKCSQWNQYKRLTVIFECWLEDKLPSKQVFDTITSIFSLRLMRMQCTQTIMILLKKKRTQTDTYYFF